MRLIDHTHDFSFSALLIPHVMMGVNVNKKCPPPPPPPPPTPLDYFRGQKLNREGLKKKGLGKSGEGLGKKGLGKSGKG